MSRFIQIHTLTSYPATLLNRDDVGFAKRIPFGGATRTRISSQCLKRHWRTFTGNHSLGEINVPGSIRSRITFERYIVEPLLKDNVASPEVVRAVTQAVVDLVLGTREEGPDEKPKGKDKKAAKGKGKTPDPDASTEAEAAQTEEKKTVHTGQVTVFGRPEVDYLKGIVQSVCGTVDGAAGAAKAVDKAFGKEQKANLKALRHAAGLDAALFGRMVTSDILARSDAALHVAHALTVHAEAAETDYFAAVDDLLGSGDDAQLGSGHIGTTELTSGLFYGYVVVDVPLLVSNLTGCDREGWKAADRTLAGKVIEHLVHLAATVTPGAKLGSTAPHAYAHLVLAEAGNAQPRTLANAFMAPVHERPDLLANTYKSLAGYVHDLDQMYGHSGARAFASVGPRADLDGALGVNNRKSLVELANWAQQRVQDAP